MVDDGRVLIKGAGDLATGVAARLWRSGFQVLMTELEQPLTIRRTVAFSEAIYDGETTVEGLTARRIDSLAEVEATWKAGQIPIMVDAGCACLSDYRPRVVIDALIAKRNVCTSLADAPFVIGLGPGFTVGQDVHAIVETNRGHYLGRVLWSGSAQPDTGVPGEIGGAARERIVYSPADGLFTHRRPIASVVEKGEIIGLAGETPVIAPLSGVLRGLIHDGVLVRAKLKIGDVDPRDVVDHCYTISDKALAIGGGVLEAILSDLHRR
jgi:xanthine dehydrogenase accessory factor